MAVAAAAVLAVAALALRRDDGSSAEDVATIPTGTAAVARTDLVSVVELTGTLGHGEATTLTAVATQPSGGDTGSGAADGSTTTTAARGDGLVTSLAPVGTTVGQGQVLWTVDEQPTFLLHGAVPAYRDLQAGVAGGEDVRQLEQALVAMGHGDAAELGPDATWTWETTEAVYAWQEATGQTVDGVVRREDVVFQPGDVVVTGHAASVGEPAGAALEVTTARRVVTGDLDDDTDGLVEVGTVVEVDLGDGRTVVGTVEAVESSTADPADPTGASSTATATVGLDPSTDLGEAAGEQAVTVRVEEDRADDALVVPVTALLALSEGGYAVEVRDGATGAARLVAVDLDLVADGRVAVTGDLAEGDEVVVPA